MPLKVAIRIGQHTFDAEGEFDFDVDFWTTLGMWLEAFHEPTDSLPDSAAVKLDQILAQGRELLMASAEVTAILNRIEAAAGNIAADVRGLKDDVNIGMTAAEVAAVKAHAERIAVAMEALAAETPDVPPAPPAPPAA